jgi:hypothetical protein
VKQERVLLLEIFLVLEKLVYQVVKAAELTLDAVNV